MVKCTWLWYILGVLFGSIFHVIDELILQLFFWKTLHENSLSILSLCFRFVGADTEFLVRLWLFHRYDIHIGYPCTATYWLSGTRSCGKYFLMYSNYLFIWIFMFKEKQCTPDMVKWIDAAVSVVYFWNFVQPSFNLFFFLFLYFFGIRKLINWKCNQDKFSGTDYGKTWNS